MDHNLLTDEDRTSLESQFNREHEQAVQGLTTFRTHFQRASELLLQLHSGTTEGQWESLLMRLNIHRSTAFRYLAAAKELKEIPVAIRAACEATGLDLTSVPVRHKVLELQKTNSKPAQIAELVGEEYLHKRKRRTSKTPMPPNGRPSPDENVRELLLSILENVYRNSNESLDAALKKLDSIRDGVREVFVEQHQCPTRPKGKHDV